MAVKNLSPETIKDSGFIYQKAQAKKLNPVSAVLAGLVVVLLVAAIVKAFLAQQAPKVVQMQVVGAGQDIMPGTRLTYSSLHYVTIPQDYYSADLFAKNNLVIGRIARSFVPKGEPLRATSLLPANSSLSQQVETHERAMTLKLDEEALVDHGIASGDKVDILFTAVKEGKKYTKTICQNIQVIFAVPKEALKSRSLQGQDAAHITLAVTPEQGEMLAQAEETGHIKLLLRNRLSRMEPRSYGVGEDDLLPQKALQKSLVEPSTVTQAPLAVNFPAAPPPPPVPYLMPTAQAILTEPVQSVQKAAQWAVEVFSGNRREIQEFPRPQAQVEK